MSLDYDKVWKTMNDLEQSISKYANVKTILNAAVDALQHRNYSEAEDLANTALDYLDYTVGDVDRDFKSAWEETVSNLNKQRSINNAWESFYYPEEVKDDGMRPWGHSDLEYLIANQIANQKTDKVKSWTLSVEIDGASGEYYVSFPQDLLDQIGWKEGDMIDWVDNGNGTFSLKKV